jgi:hypothetical protein
MTRYRTRGRSLEPGQVWSRRRMLALLIGAVVCALVLVVGLVLAVVYALHPSRRDSSHAADARTGTKSARRGASGRSGSTNSMFAVDPRDALAERAMPTVSEADSHPGPVSTANPGTPITVPASTRTGPAGVPSGFSHTPAGALAQLAAIDQTALQSGSLAVAREVITGWAMPGGPTATSWSVIGALSALFDSTGLSGGGSAQLAIVLTPLMGEIKGGVGADFVVPCVDFELDVTLAQTARGAVADCQRMVWNPDVTSPTGPSGGRWVIGPGSEPATPPSVWPDTDAAVAVGYRDLRREPTHD